MANEITEPELAGFREKNTGSRSYTNGEITVYWRPALCIHSANCLTGLPTVFSNTSRPWIKPEGASTAEIMKVVDTCPSRALTYLKKYGTAASGLQEPDSEKVPAASIQILKNGPVLIRGNYIITGADGNPIRVDHQVAAICRCGSSKKKPFCDGTHQATGFTD